MRTSAALVLTALFAGGAKGIVDDVWKVPALEQTIDSRIPELAEFPESLIPPDLEEEVVAALEALARLDPVSASARARSLLGVTSPDGAIAWASRKVLVGAFDLETIRLGLRFYFDAPEKWSTVLSAGDDVRLRDFRYRQEPEPLSERHFLSTLERNLSMARERRAIRGLLAWASTASDANSPRRVLAALPEGVPYEASIRSWLRRNPSPTEASEPALFEVGQEPLAIQQRVLSLPRGERYRATRSLSEMDHVALLGLPMSREDIDKLYPYLARSSRRAIRDRVRRAGRERGRALASLLLSPVPDAVEKRQALHAMSDAWAGAMASGGLPVYDVLASLASEEEMKRFLSLAEPSVELLDALAIVPLAEARLRLETIGAEAAIERIERREDRILSIPALVRLRESSDESAARSAERVLLSLGAPGTSARLRAQIASSSDLSPILETVVRAPIDPDVILEVVRRVASSSSSPSSFAALAEAEEHFAARFLSLLTPETSPLAERARLAMSLSGNPARIPLWIDLVMAPEEATTDESRDAAFSALAEANLASFAGRLHRLAGHTNRSIRFRAAAALVPTGEAWTVRLLLSDLDPSSPREQNVARRALARLEPTRARALLSEMIGDGTAGSFGVLAFLELGNGAEVRRDLSLQTKLWGILAEEAKASNRVALLAASRLSHPEAVSVVTERLTPP